jgi:integrase
MEARHVEAFLSHLSVKRQCSVNTQKIALNALVFLFREFFKKEMQLNYKLAKTDQRVPVVFTHLEAMSVIENLTGVYRLISQLLYGSGLRISECLRLRVKDIDFGMNHIVVRDTKGHNDRVTILLPAAIMSSNDFDTGGIVKLEKPIDFIHEYTYFSAKYPGLASAYNIALIELKASGKYEEILSSIK